MNERCWFVLSVLVACRQPLAPAEPPASPALTITAAPSAYPRFDAELSASSYPYPVAYHELTSQRQALRMAYLDVKPSQNANGKTVLLLHGKNFSAAYWQTTIELLTAHGFRVIAPDQIGFGKSTKPASYQFSFQALAESLRNSRDYKVEEATRQVRDLRGRIDAIEGPKADFASRTHRTMVDVNRKLAELSALRADANDRFALRRRISSGVLITAAAGAFLTSVVAPLL